MTPGYFPSSEFSDVNTNGYVSGPVSVTSSAIEAKVNTSRLEGREWISLFNKGPKKVYYGPSGVTSITGEPLYKDQYIVLPFGDEANVAVYLVCESGDTATVIVQEGA